MAAINKTMQYLVHVISDKKIEAIREKIRTMQAWLMLINVLTLTETLVLFVY